MRGEENLFEDKRFIGNLKLVTRYNIFDYIHEIILIFPCLLVLQNHSNSHESYLELFMSSNSI